MTATQKILGYIDSLPDRDLQRMIKREWSRNNRRPQGRILRSAGRVTREWMSWEELLAGTDYDDKIAKLLGRTSMSVARKRHHLGIAGFGYRVVTWTKEMIKVLGKEPDSVLAKRFNIGRGTVSLKRKQLNIPYLAQILLSWTASEELLLGCYHDEEVARRTGRTLGSVRQRRFVLRIENKHSKLPRWTKAELDLLGKVPDIEVAKLTGRTRGSIEGKRLGMDVVYTGALLHQWTPEDDALLGKLPDEQVAKKLNVSKQAVVHRRSRLGIKITNRRVGKSKEFHLLGKMRDWELAKLSGRTIQSIRGERAVNGIPSLTHQLRIWRPDENKLLGTMPDSEVARRLETNYLKALQKSEKPAL